MMIATTRQIYPFNSFIVIENVFLNLTRGIVDGAAEVKVHH